MDNTASGCPTGHLGDIAIGRDVVELPFHVRVPKPIQARSVVVQYTTIQSLVVQVQVVVSKAELPGTHAGHIAAIVRFEKVTVRTNAFEYT